MLTFQQRLIRYLIGILIGLLIVYAIFGNREWFGWTPGNRVLELLQDSELKMSAVAKCQLDCAGVDDAAVVLMLREGKVNFGESETKKLPLSYVIEGKSDPIVKMTFEAQDSVATLVKVVKVGVACPCK